MQGHAPRRVYRGVRAMDQREDINVGREERQLKSIISNLNLELQYWSPVVVRNVDFSAT